MADQLAALRERLTGEIEALQEQRSLLDARIATLLSVIENISQIERDNPAPANDPAPVETAHRAPRRDVQGAVLQAVHDGVMARGTGLSVADIGRGAGILLDGDALTESATLRALSALVLHGKVSERSGLYFSIDHTPDPPQSA